MSEETAGPGQRSLADRVLNLFVFAPAGAVLSAAEDWPAMAEKGRSRIDQELRNAHVIGKFAVDVGRRQVQSHLDAFFGGGSAPPRADHPSGGDPRRPGGGAGDRGSDRNSPGTPTASGPDGPPDQDPAGVAKAERISVPAAVDPVVDRALPGYDTLSASQVVRRLDGLQPEELEAVERHERDGRGRRTILTRARQLLDERAPGTAVEPIVGDAGDAGDPADPSGPDDRIDPVDPGSPD